MNFSLYRQSQGHETGVDDEPKGELKNKTLIVAHEVTPEFHLHPRMTGGASCDSALRTTYTGLSKK